MLSVSREAKKKLLSAKELAAFLGINEMTLYKHVKKGKIPGIRIGKLWRFDLDRIRREFLYEGGESGHGEKDNKG